MATEHYLPERVVFYNLVSICATDRCHVVVSLLRSKCCTGSYCPRCTHDTTTMRRVVALRFAGVRAHQRCCPPRCPPRCRRTSFCSTIELTRTRCCPCCGDSLSLSLLLDYDEVGKKNVGMNHASIFPRSPLLYSQKARTFSTHSLVLVQVENIDR